MQNRSSCREVLHCGTREFRAFLLHKFDPVTFIYELDLYPATAPERGMGNELRRQYTLTKQSNTHTNKLNSVPCTSIIGSLSCTLHVSRFPIPLFVPPAVATWRRRCLYPLKMYQQNKRNLSLSRLLKVITLQTDIETDVTKTITTLWLVTMQAANICDTMTNKCRDHSIIKTQTYQYLACQYTESQ